MSNLFQRNPEFYHRNTLFWKDHYEKHLSSSNLKSQHLAARKSQKSVGFWANNKVHKVTDIRKYNRAVSRLWFVFAILYEIVGIPLLFCEQNSPIVLISVFGTVALVIGLMIGYLQIEIKYKK